MVDSQRLALVALDAFLAFIALGTLVANTAHSAYDLQGMRFRGRAVDAAVIFTESGRWRQLTSVSAVGLVVFALMRWPLWIPIALMLSQIVSQAVVEAAKRMYRRVRPRDFLVRAEYGFSYPSGHASTAVTFYLAWALVAALLPLPLALRVVLVAFLALWAIGVLWSRIALAAHYLTDVLGGCLFGAAWLCAMLAIGVQQHLHLI